MADLPQCEWTPDDDYCDEPSRFRVERTDDAPGYEPSESCPKHLADTVATLAEGLPIAITVTVHWDEG